VDEYIDKLDFNGYLMEVWKMIQEMNKLIDESKPWVLAKTDREKLTEVLCKVIEALGVVANSLEPIMPDTAVKIKTQLKTLQPEPLFPRID
jgi:methionyl-tRNA synthetase